jgi:hypothetical protein
MGPSHQCGPLVSLGTLCTSPPDPALAAARQCELAAGNPTVVVPDRSPHHPPAAAAPTTYTLTLGLSHHARALRLACARRCPLQWPGK